MCNDDLTSWHRSAFKVDELLTSSKLKTGLYMDTIEAKKNLNALCNEIEKLQNLSRSLMSAKEMLDIDAKIKRHKDQVKNIRSNLYA